MEQIVINITLIIIIITCLISWQALEKPSLQNRLLHYPYREARNKEFDRWISSGFVHANFFHLAINMYVLYGFGSFVESAYKVLFGKVMGSVYYVILYLAGIVAANIATYIQNKNNSNFLSVGASGAVSAVMFASILLAPDSMIGFFFVIPMKAVYAGIVYLIYSSYAARSMGDNIDHVAHFYGAVFGFVFTWILAPGLIHNFMEQLW